MANGHRPGQIITHAHPAYLYGGGTMLQQCYEYFGMLSVWVPPPDTDELAEQAVRFWTRVRPDHPFMGFATGRFVEVATKLGISLEEAGLTGLKAPIGFGLGRGGMPLMTAGAECYSFVGGPCGVSPGAHLHEDWAVVQAVDPSTGLEVADGEWGNLTVTTLDRDNGLLRYDLEEACAILRSPCPCGETSARGLWGGRFKDLLSCQGTRFQLAEVEGVLRDVAAMREPSLEYQIVRPGGGDQDLVVMVEVASADPAIREGARIAAVAGLRESLGVRGGGGDPRPGHHPARRLQGDTSGRSRLAIIPHAPSLPSLGAPCHALPVRRIIASSSIHPHDSAWPSQAGHCSRSQPWWWTPPRVTPQSPHRAVRSRTS